MHDRIFLKNYRKTIEIGAFQEERLITQDLLFSIEVEVANAYPYEDDAVDLILSYDHLVNAVEDNLSRQRYNLLEALAEDIAQEILKHETAKSCTVSIEKIGRVDGALGVRISRMGKGNNLLSLSTNSELVVIYEGHPPSIPEPGQIFLPMSQLIEPQDEAERHIAILKLDQFAWKLSQALDLPVIDTRTEREALLKRGEGFIFAFGKQVFSATPPLDQLTDETLIQWAGQQLGTKNIKKLGAGEHA